MCAGAFAMYGWAERSSSNRRAISARVAGSVMTTMLWPWLKPPDGARRITRAIRSICSRGIGSGRNDRCIRRRARMSRSSTRRAYRVARVRTVAFQELESLVGEELGSSDWHLVDQERVNSFAEVTGDHQWIHVDPERAAAGPFGGTIAHGYLTLSLSNAFLPEIVEFRGITMGVNYGTGKVRFPAPVPVGSRIRGRATLTEVADV